MHAVSLLFYFERTVAIGRPEFVRVVGGRALRERGCRFGQRVGKSHSLQVTGAVGPQESLMTLVEVVLASKFRLELVQLLRLWEGEILQVLDLRLELVLLLLIFAFRSVFLDTGAAGAAAALFRPPEDGTPDLLIRLALEGLSVVRQGIEAALIRLRREKVAVDRLDCRLRERLRLTQRGVSFAHL